MKQTFYKVKNIQRFICKRKDCAQNKCEVYEQGNKDKNRSTVCSDFNSMHECIKKLDLPKKRNMFCYTSIAFMDLCFSTDDDGNVTKPIEELFPGTYKNVSFKAIKKYVDILEDHGLIEKIKIT